MAEQSTNPTPYDSDSDDSMSEEEVSAVKWSPRNLTNWWPVHRLPDNIPARDQIVTRISPDVNKQGGYTVQEIFGDKVKKQKTRTIPLQYRNALCILSSKICWLQHKVSFLRALPAKERKDPAIDNLLDGLRRNLMFSIKVRQAFYEEVAEYDQRTGHRHSEKQPYLRQFSSRSLDSWLHVEFHAVTHHPPRYQELSQGITVAKHPLDITRDGGHQRILFPSNSFTHT
jgi:hypothetical protein